MSQRKPLMGLEAQGISTGAQLHWNLVTAALVEQAVARGEGVLAADGPLVVATGRHTGRSAQDKFTVCDAETEASIWWGKSNKPMAPEHFAALKADFLAALAPKDVLFVQDLYGGSQPEHRVKVRVINELAWHNLFIRTMLVRPAPEDLAGFTPDFTIIDLPSFRADPARHGCRSETVIAVSITDKLILIGGTQYAGEMKKSVFGLLNYLLPPKGIMPMHCSANIGPRGDTAVFFGLSGTGKTTLSADPHRKLIGDDEHAWTAAGISNLEDGCYAKLIDLDKDAEPGIAAALSMPGTLIENVPALPGRALEDTDPQDLDLGDGSITENTRFSYPLTCNPNVAEGARGPHPETIVLLTADAFGVLPPLSILDPKEVMYHFVMGFTAKLAGTEVGVTEPKAAFSACFGSPFMAQKPSVYARGLAEKMARHEARCILLNTGWSGGPYGVGKRISIKDTRALLDAALAGELHAEGNEYDVHPIFQLKMPRSCTGVDSSILNPRNAWEDKDAYDKAATQLRDLFRTTFEEKGFASLGIEPVM